MPNGYDIAVFSKGVTSKKFQRKGLRGSKNENFEKIPPKPKRASKIGYLTCATPKRRKKNLKLFVTDIGGGILKFRYRLLRLYIYKVYCSL